MDLVAVKNLLDEKQILEQVGGSSYLAELVHVVPNLKSRPLNLYFESLILNCNIMSNFELHTNGSNDVTV